MNGKYVFFWQTEKGKKLGPGCLSQWARVGFVVDGVYYRYAEQFMMAEKARLFGDDVTLNKIMDAKSPMIIKHLGRAVKGRAGGKWDCEDAAKWKTVRSDVVLRGTFAKFAQNDALKEYLLSTGDAILAEASPHDAIWGIGIDAETAAKTPQAKWPGKNLLGKALMKVREMLNAGEDDTDTVRDAKARLAECLKEEELGRMVNAEFGKAKSGAKKRKPEREAVEVEQTDMEREAVKKLISNEKRSSELFVPTRITLLRRVNAGDKKAFEEFYNLYCPAMLKFVGLADGAKTERDQWDLVQTVFAKFYKTFAMVEDPDTGEKRMPRDLLSVMVRKDKKTGKTCNIKFRQYLIACLKNAITTKWRHDTHNGKVTELSMDGEVSAGTKNSWKDIVIDPHPGPSVRLEQKERQERDDVAVSIWLAVVRGYLLDEALDGCVRDITYRSIAEGVSADALAKKWGVSRNNADQIKHRGVKKAEKITRAIYELLKGNSTDIEADVRRLYEAVAAMRPSKHIDKFMIQLAKEILNERG